MSRLAGAALPGGADVQPAPDVPPSVRHRRDPFAEAARQVTDRRWSRRRFALALSALLPWIGVVRAQPKLRRIGLLISGLRPEQGESPGVAALVAALRDVGVGVEPGPRLAIEVRYGGLSEAAMAAAAAELVALAVDVIVASLTPATVAARRATDRIPIVMAGVGDPLASGLAASLSQPGGNVTGHGGFGQVLAAKNLELLREWLPHARQVGVLSRADVPFSPLFVGEVARAAQRFGLALRVKRAVEVAQYDAAISGWGRDPVDAALVQPTVSFRHALPRVRRHRLPSCSFARGWAAKGGLFAYAFDVKEANAIVAGCVRRILDGEAPASMPVQQSSRFGLHLNDAAAAELGLVVPAAVRLRADEVIR